MTFINMIEELGYSDRLKVIESLYLYNSNSWQAVYVTGKDEE